MRTVLIVAAALLVTACGNKSPIAPASSAISRAQAAVVLIPPTATLSLTIVSSRTGQPLRGMSLTLIRNHAPADTSDNRTTDVYGRASWTVETSTSGRHREYSFLVYNTSLGTYRMNGGNLDGDAGWLLSLPD